MKLVVFVRETSSSMSTEGHKVRVFGEKERSGTYPVPRWTRQLHNEQLHDFSYPPNTVCAIK
jgi:hypothetical protein